MDMMKPITLFLALVFSIVATACAQGKPVEPTGSLQTVVALTGQAVFTTAAALTKTAPPAATFIPTETSIPLPDIPSSPPTFAAGFTEFAQIRFLTPGPSSILVSPINLQMELVSGESETVQVDLLGEDGRVLFREVEKVTRNVKGLFCRFEPRFEIRAVTEAGYIRVSTKDDFGRIQALNTMPVLLYSIGASQVNPPGNRIYERIMIEGMKEKANFYAGEVGLKGRIWPFNHLPMVVELVKPNGSVISTRVLTFEGMETQSFETLLPYEVSEPTMVRLTFRQDNPLLAVSDAELHKFIYVYSVEIQLNP